MTVANRRFHSLNFYINDSGKPEYRDGVAKFFHVWLLKEGMKMARVVSYEHRDAPYQSTRKEVTIQPEVIAPYVGKYKATKTGVLVVTRDNNLLIVTVGGDKKFLLHPESENVFFVADRDLTFEFVKGRDQSLQDRRPRTRCGRRRSTARSQ